MGGTPAHTLNKALRAEMKSCGGFLQEPLMRSILTLQQVTDLLAETTHLPRPECEVVAGEILGKHDTEPTYVIILSILILMQRSEEILQFKAAQVDDSKLPLRYDESNDCFCVGDSAITCIPGWRITDNDLFGEYQRKLSVPYMEIDSVTGKARHYIFSEDLKLPWHDGLEKKEYDKNGGFSTVYPVEILPQCQGFGKLLKEMGLNNGVFALKILRPNTKAPHIQERRYRDEVKQLHNFNGATHPNLVTILASYEIGRNYHFLFPWAEHNLAEYWRQFPNPNSRDGQTVTWFTQQLRGIASAVNTIHNPSKMKVYGRHGDIKPENILFFRSDKYPEGILVITDMGLTVIHGTKSRSMIPNKTVFPGDFNYQAPEMDVEGATISRAYDVWTLGCLFLEMTVWLVTGIQGLDEFGESRQTTHGIEKFMMPNFYDIVSQEQSHDNQPDLQTHGVWVKPQVVQMYDRIRQSNKSSRLVCDILDFVQNEMIVVLSETQKRSGSKAIMDHFDNIAQNCITKGPVYYQSPFFPPHEHGRGTETNPVQVKFNTHALSTMRKKQPKFGRYPGEFQRPLSPHQYRELDGGPMEE